MTDHMDHVVFGIDFGSKLTGNTVIAIFKEGNIYFMQVEKEVDADEFILNAAGFFRPEIVFIDAPLSLPGRYCGLNGCTDYHFRKADKAVKAMSPLFIGGITARAMKLRDTMEDMDIEVHETYPRIMAEKFKLMEIGYKGSKSCLNTCRNRLRACIKPDILIDCSDIKTWHHLDALLALMSALNYLSDDHEIFGDKEEGQIYI